MFFLNEKRIDYEGCDVGECSWSYIRSKFSDLIQTCNVEWCHNKSSHINFQFPAVLFFSLIIYFVAL